MLGFGTKYHNCIVNVSLGDLQHIGIRIDRRMEQSESERYEELGLREALNRPHRFPLACNELSSILRNAYSQLPKNLQSLIFQDTLLAFRLLPGMQMQASISAVNSLLHSVEVALPKQKRNLAAKEFKHAIIAHKRQCKASCDEDGSIQLHQDLLAHIFHFLDLQTLLLAASVCRSWRGATCDNHMWQLIYTDFFGISNNHSNDIGIRNYASSQNMQHTWQEEINTATSVVDWKEAFKRAYKDWPSKKLLTYQRGYCSFCRSVVWLNNGKCSNKHIGKGCRYHVIKPVSTQQIVDYILLGSTIGSTCNCDSDPEESEDESVFRLWAFPMRLVKPLLDLKN